MIELNLLPDIKQEFVHAKRQKRIVIVAMILTSAAAIGIVAVLGFYAYVGQLVRQNLADGEIKDLSGKLQKKKNLVQNLTVQNQLASIQQLHESKGVYGRLFEYLKILNPETPNNVSISKVSVDSITGTVALEASAKDYPAVTVFKDTLENAKLSYVDPETKEKVEPKLFTEVIISSPTLAQDSAGQQVTAFKVNLTYEPAAFSWTIPKISLKVPKLKTNQSAKGVSVFADKAPAIEGGAQ